MEEIQFRYVGMSVSRSCPQYLAKSCNRNFSGIFNTSMVSLHSASGPCRLLQYMGSGVFTWNQSNNLSIISIISVISIISIRSLRTSNCVSDLLFLDQLEATSWFIRTILGILVKQSP